MTQKTNQNPWTMDVRVRERNLKSGALTDKDLEKHLAALPDVADQAEAFAIAQPALAQQHLAVSEATGNSAADDDLGDEEEEEDDEDEGADTSGDSAEGDPS
jgi:ribosomal protein L12E/L44/L45/RPP1/RPP2